MPPVLWLGAAILLASLAGCIWMIVIAAGDTDSEVTTRGTTILKVPVERTPLSAPTARGESAPR